MVEVVECEGGGEESKEGEKVEKGKGEKEEGKGEEEEGGTEEERAFFLPEEGVTADVLREMTGGRGREACLRE